VLRERLGDALDVRILLPPDPIPADARGIDWADVWCDGPEQAAA
jgi:hypothetical protein